MFDQSVVTQLEKDVGKQTLAQLFQVFSTESKKLTLEIMSCELLDEATIRSCHSLKSCSCSYGAVALADLAESLEQSARQQDHSFFIQRAELQALFTKTINAIPKF